MGNIWDKHSGVALRHMTTTPSPATMLAAAQQLEIPKPVAVAAVDVLCGGTATGVVLSGKMGAGKDVLAAKLNTYFTNHPELGINPGHVHQTSDPIRKEYAEVLGLLTECSHNQDTPLKAAQALAGYMGLPTLAAARLTEMLYPQIQTGETIYPHSRTPQNRAALQFLADAGRRSYDPQYWTKQYFQAVYQTIAKNQTAFLTGGRYPNEVGPAQTLGLFTCRIETTEPIRIARIEHRDGFTPDTTTLHDPNECALDNYLGFNLVVLNNADITPTVQTITNHLQQHTQLLNSTYTTHNPT